MIEIRNLTVAFGGVRGLNDLSADIGAKITGLVGPNGAGKTTLLNAMSGFVKCASGTVIVDGVDLLRIAMNRRAAFGLRRIVSPSAMAPAASVGPSLPSVPALKITTLGRPAISMAAASANS